MSDLLSPGVSIKEIDYSEYVSSASTCSCGMVGEARRGPIGVPTLVTTQKELISMFGDPIPGMYGIYGALAYLTQGNQLYYTRVVQGGIVASAGEVGTDKLTFTAVGPGSEYNGIVVAVTSTPPAEGSSDPTKYTITVKKGSEVIETYADAVLEGAGENNISVLINGKSNYIIVVVNETGSVTDKEYTLAGGSGSGSYSRAGQVGVDKVVFRSKYFEADLNNSRAVLSEMDGEYFDVTILNTAGKVLETWKSLSLDPNDERFAENFINNRSRRIVVEVDTTEGDGAIAYKAGTLTFTGGDSGYKNITAKDIIGEDDETGLHSFANAELVDIDILCAPGWYDVSVINAGLAICENENRADCIYIADPPFGLSVQGVVEWSNGQGSYAHDALNSSYGALYWPWVKIPDSYTNKDLWMPPSGYVAAQYAYNDRVARQWNAPAGLNRGIMAKPISLEKSPTSGERDYMYGNRNIVNPLVNFLGQGILIWGQKTMQRKPSALDRVNVRRLMNYLKKVIGASTKYFVFEQNDPSTWTRWKNMVEPVLRSVKDNFGIYDYKIEIEPSADDIENNRMPAVVKIKPTKVAEYIPLEFQIMPYSESFED